MFDRWQACQRWLDSPDSDWLHDSIDEGTATREMLLDLLADFNLPNSDIGKLYAELTGMVAVG